MSGRHEIESRRAEIAAICREHGVARLLVFGSVLREDFDPERSDIDLLVEFLPGVSKGWMAEYADLKDAMEHLFDRKVDVLPAEIKRNPYLKVAIDREKELLYAA
jgi:predicted nucleotidyltransferase